MSQRPCLMWHWPNTQPLPSCSFIKGSLPFILRSWTLQKVVQVWTPFSGTCLSFNAIGRIILVLCLWGTWWDCSSLMVVGPCDQFGQCVLCDCDAGPSGLEQLVAGARLSSYFPLPCVCSAWRLLCRPPSQRKETWCKALQGLLGMGKKWTFPARSFSVWWCLLLQYKSWQTFSIKALSAMQAVDPFVILPYEPQYCENRPRPDWVKGHNCHPCYSNWRQETIAWSSHHCFFLRAYPVLSPVDQLPLFLAGTWPNAATTGGSA